MDPTTSAVPTPDDAERIARDSYGIDVRARSLQGEYDCNFCLETPAGERFLLKIAREGTTRGILEFQNAILEHLAACAPELAVQRVLLARDGTGVASVAGAAGRPRFARLLTYLPGRLLVHTRPHTPALLRGVGAFLGKMDAALASFSHRFARRSLKWDLSRAEWIGEYIAEIAVESRRNIVRRHLEHYLHDVQPRLANLRWSVAHNDCNDYNVLVEGRGDEARVSGLVDFGDAIFTPTACNLAIALAYAMLDKHDPVASASHVVAGYHASNILSEDELAVLFHLAIMRLAVSVTNSAHRKTLVPDDPYVTISEVPAWEALERLEAVHPRLAHYTFRGAAGYEPVPDSSTIVAWLKDHAVEFASPVAADLRTGPVLVHDLSVGSLELGLVDEIDTAEKLTRRLLGDMEAAGARAGIGRYGEARLFYSGEDFRTAGEDAAEYRTVHIGMDIFMRPAEPVFAPLDGVLHSFRDNAARHDYGPCMILEHRVSAAPSKPLVFHTLYGHLSRESLAGLEPGTRIRRGERFAAIGDSPVNGDWPPHLHFQVITDLLDFEGTFPGVARPGDRSLWKSLCPDPNIICGVPARHFSERPPRGEEILESRRNVIGYNVSVSYRRPLTAVRGHGQYLYDEDGRRYLDFYNNVPHVGHSNPYVVRAVQSQLAVLNTNTRYLHENLVRYARRLAATLPAPLRVCYFVCSGSEATELAIRLARAHSRGRDLIVCEGAYHGHTTTLIDVSPYKAEGPGGQGLPDWVHRVPLPDTYRGKYRSEVPDAGLRYAHEIIPVIERLRSEGRKLSGFLIESIPSVAGQIPLPDGYLPEAYSIVRDAGGVCIADEVQTGLGRIGSHFWAFQRYEVSPDIVAMGKPIGNGYPIGAVVTTEEIAASFDNGMEYFVTFGGTPVSCAAGMAVLDVIEREELQRNASELGNRLIAGLRGLQHEHGIIGDVRGLGLMLGVELVLDRAARSPAPDQAAYVCNRLRERGILIGTDGLDHNVLKIRGPMVLAPADADFFIEELDRVLNEDAARP